MKSNNGKCIILFGGRGTRLSHRGFSNKAFILIQDKPVAYYIINNLKKIFNDNDFIFITNPEHKNELQVIINKYFNFNPVIIEQSQPNGIPSAIALAKDYIKEDYFSVCLGDFYCEEILDLYKNPINSNIIITNKVKTPWKYGILINNEIIEKPSIGELAVRGFYVFHKSTFDLMNNLVPSKRMETEIVDVLNQIKFKQFEVRKVYDLGSDEGLTLFEKTLPTLKTN